MPTPLKKIIIITAASGSGKTSIVKHLLKKNPEQLDFSISCASRQKRNNEADSIDYYFISPDEFKEKITKNEFVEWEMVYEGKYYGTLKTELERIWVKNKTPLLDIDVKGALAIQQLFPKETLSIFIAPPSIAELKKRLEARGTETPESLATRVHKATDEIIFQPHFTTTIVNDNLQKAGAEAEELVRNFLQIRAN